MCGIFGLIQRDNPKKASHLFRDLFLLSESRGKEASGFAIHNENEIIVFKTPFPASTLVNSEEFRNHISKSQVKPFVGMGHSRLVTNGYEHKNSNNQPVVKDDFIVIHNGIIVNYDELWKKYHLEERMSDLDSELIPVIIKNHLSKGFGEAVKCLFSDIEGMTNTGILSSENKNLLLATNNGSIYYTDSMSKGIFVFASERYIIEQLIQKNKLDKDLYKIIQLLPGTLLNIDFSSFSSELSTIGDKALLNTLPEKVKIHDISGKNIHKSIHLNTSLEHLVKDVPGKFYSYCNHRKAEIQNLKRCTKCILPETFPFIEFDRDGVCNYCNNHQKHEVKGKEELQIISESHRTKNNKPECLVPFSGGRDSSYALHFAVKELGLKPIAFSYDWGMLTDLARRNQSRMCGKLGVEHILVSADIRKKRSNIRKNVLAWLHKPDLGTVPLFMAGDKQYFYFANLLMKQNSLGLSLFGENLLETTNFKSGFCGIKPVFGKNNTYQLGSSGKFKMSLYYLTQFLSNPRYLNSSLLDSLEAFKSYYLIKHQNLNIYDYIKWDENIIEKTLINEYNWETDPGTKTTWRIGDGTAAFYNYIYFNIAGFSENDTFRSNQVREGDISRKEALELSIIENDPRWDSIQWYCNTINIDFISTIERINTIKSLF